MGEVPEAIWLRRPEGAGMGMAMRAGLQQGTFQGR